LHNDFYVDVPAWWQANFVQAPVWGEAFQNCVDVWFCSIARICNICHDFDVFSKSRLFECFSEAFFETSIFTNYVRLGVGWYKRLDESRRCPLHVGNTVAEIIGSKQRACGMHQINGFFFFKGTEIGAAHAAWN